MPTAIAKTVTVTPGGAVPTIQDGVDLAAAGDTVLVKPGVYQETVTVPAGKDGLRLVAKGKVVVDARGPAGAPLGPALTIESPNVLVRGFVFRHAATDTVNALPGHGVSAEADGVRIEKCGFLHCADRAVSIAAGGVRVSGCRVVGGSTAVGGAGDDALLVGLRVERCLQGVILQGDRTVVQGSRFEVLDSTAIALTGADVVVRKNRVESGGGGGVDVTGSGARVEKNRVFDVLDPAISVSGDAATVRGNRARAVDEVALFVSGDGATVEKNVLNDVGGGVQVLGGDAVVRKNRVRNALFNEAVFVSGSAPMIADNRLTGTATGQSGVTALNAAGGTIADNVVRQTTAEGIFVDGNSAGISVLGNLVRDAGSSAFDDTGISVASSGALIAENRVRRALNDGIRVLGDDAQILGNVVVQNGFDGIDLEALSGGILKKNVARKNHAEGIENNSTGVTVVKNRSKGNRIDFANSGTIAVFKKNKIGDGSDPSTSPEVD